MTYSLEALARERDDPLLDHFDYHVAWRLGLAMRERAAREAMPVAITKDQGRDLVLSLLMPGAIVDNLDWAARNRAVVWRFHRSALGLRLESQEQGIDFDLRYRLPEVEDDRLIVEALKEWTA